MIQSKLKKHLVSWYICSSTVVDTLYWNSFAVFQVILNRKKENQNHDLADKTPGLQNYSPTLLNYPLTPASD